MRPRDARVELILAAGILFDLLGLGPQCGVCSARRAELRVRGAARVVLLMGVARRETGEAAVRRDRVSKEQDQHGQWRTTHAARHKRRGRSRQLEHVASGTRFDVRCASRTPSRLI
jgi:hypothetical protein